MSMARLSAGAGYRYLLRYTAAGDAARPQATALVDYYAATGYPPGRWLGSGLAGLNDGATACLQPGSGAGHSLGAPSSARRRRPGDVLTIASVTIRTNKT